MAVQPEPGYDLKKSVEKSRKKDKFHVFPHGLIHRGEKSYQRMLPGPLIKEVGEGAQEQGKQDTSQEIGGFFMSHENESLLFSM